MYKIKRRLKRFLLNLFYRKLWIKIAVILIIIVSVPVILLGISLINFSQEAVKNSVLNNHKQIITRAAAQIQLFIKKPEDVLKTTAAMLGTRFIGYWEQETILVELVLNQPVFMRVCSIDVSGKLIASSELGKEIPESYIQEVLAETKSGQRYLSRVKFLDNHTPYQTMGLQIKDMETIVGVLIADVNLRGMWEIIDDIRLDKTGRAFLVSSDGTLIAHPDKRRVLKNENFKDQKDVQAVLAGQTDALEMPDESGKKWISAYAPISGVGWGIVLRQAQSEAYLFSNVMKMQSLLIMFFSELIGILVSIYMAKFLVRPIKALAEKFKLVANGDLEHKIGRRRRDEIGELMMSFNNMTEKLKEAKSSERFSKIGESVLWITHELKNSLIAIKSFAYLFPKRHHDKIFVNKFSKLIPGEIKRWEDMLKELSDFSSPAELRKVEIDVKELLYNLLAIVEEKFKEKKIDLSCDAPDKNFRMLANPEKIRQVIMNLIINAADAMPEGGRLEVSLDLVLGESLHLEAPPLPKARFDNIDLLKARSSLDGWWPKERGPRYILIKFQDTGNGIPADELEKIFNPFHTKKKEGLGLGLSISRKIIEQHGGRIEVKSEVGMGTNFIVKLPVKSTKP